MSTKSAYLLEAAKWPHPPLIKVLKANFSPLENYYMKPLVSLHGILQPRKLPNIRFLLLNFHRFFVFSPDCPTHKKRKNLTALKFTKHAVVNLVLHALHCGVVHAVYIAS